MKVTFKKALFKKILSLSVFFLFVSASYAEQQRPPDPAQVHRYEHAITLALVKHITADLSDVPVEINRLASLFADLQETTQVDFSTQIDHLIEEMNGSSEVDALLEGREFERAIDKLYCQLSLTLGSVALENVKITHMLLVNAYDALRLTLCVN